MLIVSSLPPRGRLIRNGRDIQADAVASWRNAGFFPISVNAQAEGDEHAQDVETILAERDATVVTGRPRVYFSDLLRLGAHRATGAPFAITNADILLEGQIADSVAGLKKGQFLFAHRRDLFHANDRPGVPYLPGLDFFALHPSDAMTVADTSVLTHL